MQIDVYYQARDILEDLLRKDLLGPLREDEVISERPDDYYICGRLFPQQTRISEEEIEGRAGDVNEEFEVPLNLCYSSMPSSMAFTFTVRPGIHGLEGETTFARYEPEKEEIRETGKKEDDNGEEKKEKKKYYRTLWRRISESVSFEIDTAPSAAACQIIPLERNLELRIYLHSPRSDGSRSVTVAMINTAKEAKSLNERAANTFFQPRIEVRGINGTENAFAVGRPLVRPERDPEMLNLEMLYRHNPFFATGHGCSVDWKADGEYASRIWTEFIPAREVLQMEPAGHVRKETLSFYFLSNGDRKEVVRALVEMADSYERWIEERTGEITYLPGIYRGPAEENMKKCRENLQRIRGGIDLLAEDNQIFLAFRLMNRAMLLQRTRGGEQPDEQAWYPFQLAFVLQVLGSVAKREDPWRKVVDLLWFPTGGGKTEAYLGLAAFAIFLRRLRAAWERRDGGGVTVIMRYTLRLLTLQQFERAMALICACEIIRRDNPALLGETEIAAGLWVGGRLTPNSIKETEKALEKIKTIGLPNTLTDEEPNPCQVLACPWCGTGTPPQYYEIVSGTLRIFCPREDCPFHGGLPVYLVDEDIYRLGPTFLLSTVDKYARIAWEPRAGRLFGVGTPWQPPELIIQDELHLISGPLGTIAGLYEVAIEELCRREGSDVKIISSTATIRHASEQISSLYGRESSQFPPQGLDIRDSYLAREADRDSRPARRYLGILAPGTSGNTLLIRIYALLLMARDYLRHRDFPAEVVDSFWTLTGYFNTLKQLGGALVNIFDDVDGRMKYLYRTKFSYLFDETWPPSFLRTEELTGRRNSSEIAQVLEKLDVGFPEEEAVDIVLASSMFSVGVDIGRLGLMVVQGQPKTSSEYIQATSRIGRRTPGLVVTMYDASRSRDRSHYERFRAYHASLYRYVEATSLTPFAERARERALHAVLVSLCRHLVPALHDNRSAGNIGEYFSRAKEIIEKIVDRASRVEPGEAEEVRRELTWILEQWERMSGPDLAYQKFGNDSCRPLLVHRFGGDRPGFPTLNSMREIDVECKIILEG